MNLISNITKTPQLFIILACSYTGSAFAVTAPATITFSDMNTGRPGASSAYYGKANITATDPQGCNTSSTKCYFEAGFSVGSVIDPAPGGDSAHLHRGGSPTTRKVLYHGDSGGIYIRTDDFSAFSFDSASFDTINLQGSNPDAGVPASYFEVLGFKDALNPDLATWNWTADPTYGGKRIAYQIVPNVNSIQTIVLNDPFKNVKAVWIHYVNHPRVPTDGIEFSIGVTAIQLSPPQTICP